MRAGGDLGYIISLIICPIIYLSIVFPFFGMNINTFRGQPHV